MDDVDTELVRLTLWALFAAANLAAGGHEADAARTADATLAAAGERFPFLKPAPEPDLGLFS